MASLFQYGNYGAINTDDTTTNVFYVIKFISESYTLQNNITIDKKIELFLVHDTIQWLNCIVHYINVKMNWKLGEKINAKLWSALKLERV